MRSLSTNPSAVYSRKWRKTPGGQRSLVKSNDKHQRQIRAWKKRHPGHVRKWMRTYNEKLKRCVFEHYGGTPPACACCGEGGYVFLSLDHKNGDGAAFRRNQRNSGGLRIYQWIMKKVRKTGSWPVDFQVLCFNCNFAKGTGKQCPHQTGEVALRRKL